MPPLTRNGYSRLPSVEADMRAVWELSGPALAAAFRQGEEGAPEYLSAEALVFFIRRELSKGDRHTAEALFGNLVDRCMRAFRSLIRGVDDDVREDIQSDVLADLARLLLADDDVGDFLQCRFWLYLRRRTVTARAACLRSKRSLLLADDLGGGDDAGSAGGRTLEETALSPEDRMILLDALSRLPPDLRELMVLRHYEGWRIGDEPVERADPADPSLAKRYGITARGIRKRLARAHAILNDGEN